MKVCKSEVGNITFMEQWSLSLQGNIKLSETNQWRFCFKTSHVRLIGCCQFEPVPKKQCFTSIKILLSHLASLGLFVLEGWWGGGTRDHKFFLKKECSANIVCLSFFCNTSLSLTSTGWNGSAFKLLSLSTLTQSSVLRLINSATSIIFSEKKIPELRFEPRPSG